MREGKKKRQQTFLKWENTWSVYTFEAISNAFIFYPMISNDPDLIYHYPHRNHISILERVRACHGIELLDDMKWP